jgi:hypothetical protein
MTAIAMLAPPVVRTGTVRRQLTVGVIVLAMASLPLLRPAGPGNTAFADVGLVAAALVTALWLSGHGQRVHVPYAWPVLLTIGSGALAAVIAGTSGLPLIQDAFVFAWPVALVNLARDVRALEIMVKAWAYSAVMWASLLIIGVSAGLPWLAGTTARDGARASFTLGDPNLAANYFLCALFVLRACQRPHSRKLRWLCCGLVVAALGLTLSNGGALTLLIATEMGWIFGVARRRGMAPAIALSALLIALSGIAVATINLNTLADKAQQSTPLLRDSIGRQGESGGSRTTLMKAEIHLWLTDHTLVGIGPGQIKETLIRQDAPYAKEAHNDYLAALVERGVIGAGAVILLAGGLAVRCRRIARPGALPPEYAAVIPRPELLGALLVGVAVSAGLYETLHFRHVWAVFGLIAALELAARRAAKTAPEVPT